MHLHLRHAMPLYLQISSLAMLQLQLRLSYHVPICIYINLDIFTPLPAYVCITIRPRNHTIRSTYHLLVPTPRTSMEKANRKPTIMRRTGRPTLDQDGSQHIRGWSLHFLRISLPTSLLNSPFHFHRFMCYLFLKKNLKKLFICSLFMFHSVPEISLAGHTFGIIDTRLTGRPLNPPPLLRVAYHKPLRLTCM